jgi:hypothetical protein
VESVIIQGPSKNFEKLNPNNGKWLGLFELLIVVFFCAEISRLGIPYLMENGRYYAFFLFSLSIAAMAVAPLMLLYSWGWVLGLLGHLCFILSALSLKLRANEFEYPGTISLLVTLIFHSFCLLIYWTKPIFSLYAYPSQRYWIRTKRHDFLAGGVLKLGTSSVSVQLENISSTGCLFTTDHNLPISEIGGLVLDQIKKGSSYRIQIQRRFSTEGEPHQKYGAKFLKSLTQMELDAILCLPQENANLNRLVG